VISRTYRLFCVLGCSLSTCAQAQEGDVLHVILPKVLGGRFVCRVWSSLGWWDHYAWDPKLNETSVFSRARRRRNSYVRTMHSAQDRAGRSHHFCANPGLIEKRLVCDTSRIERGAMWLNMPVKNKILSAMPAFYCSTCFLPCERVSCADAWRCAVPAHRGRKGTTAGPAGGRRKAMSLPIARLALKNGWTGPRGVLRRHFPFRFFYIFATSPWKNQITHSSVIMHGLSRLSAADRGRQEEGYWCSCWGCCCCTTSFPPSLLTNVTLKHVGR